MAPEIAQARDTDSSGRWLDWLAVLRSPATVWNVCSLLFLAAAITATLAWSQKQIFLAPGQIAGESRASRVMFQRIDEVATQAERQAAALRSPRVYVADSTTLSDLIASLQNLPRSLADAQEVKDVDPVIRAQFAITAASALQAIREQAQDGQPTATWLERVKRLSEMLQRTALVDEQTFQRQSQAAGDRVQLRVGSEKFEARTTDVVNTESVAVEGRLRSMVDASGFTGELANCVSARLRHRLTHTFTYDEDSTRELARQASERVEPKRTTFVPGQVLVTEGDRLTQERLALIAAEGKEYRKNFDATALMAQLVGVAGVGLLAALGLGGYTATYASWLWNAPVRTAALCGIVALALLLACWAAAADPRLVNLCITAPTLLVTVILCVAYDRRTALALGSLLGILTCVATDQPPVAMGVSLCGVWVAVWRLGEFRQRNALIRAGLVTGMAIAAASLLVAGLRRPMVYPDGIDQALLEATSAAIGAILVGFIALGLLPTIERLFDVTTGMSLIELRDPRHPLLRMLQQRAPGTYNHSLNVAGLAEAAAEAIKADGLLAYVGALYHDVGKVTKPEYFVENHSGGPSRHDRLPPAISHLVIVGHVQEGLELAREHNLPRSLHHFIESHHGTTLVEFFYQRARKQAEAAASAGSPGTLVPLEAEFRYPGPKPRTREAAILMICDAAESATRTLADPSPARIDSLVRAIAHKRLLDGQFDASPLTMRDLAAIVDAISRTLAAVHHQRVEYPEPAGALEASASTDVPRGAPTRVQSPEAAPVAVTNPSAAAPSIRPLPSPATQPAVPLISEGRSVPAKGRA